jgi:CBS-domain-containing membrane protein
VSRPAIIGGTLSAKRRPESEDEMNVADVMTRPAYTCSPHEPLSRAAQLMWDQDVGAVPVVDREARAIAMITDRDICMAAFTQNRPMSELRVQQAMSKVVYTCHPEDRLSAAERTMRVHRVRRLPVVDDAGRILGTLSINDICRARAAAALGGLSADVVTTLATIGKPRGIAPKEAAPELPVRVPIYRASDARPSSSRMPPPPMRDPAALFRF